MTSMTRYCSKLRVKSTRTRVLTTLGRTRVRKPTSTELLNTLQPNGMPRHTIKLNVGVPIILLRNVSRSAGLMNSTQLVVTACLRYSVQATILTGTRKGSSGYIPRINLTPAQDAELGLHFIRHQLPIKLAYCITVNKSQGQTLKVVVLLLKVPVFFHGQAYVALSRVGQPDAVYVMVLPSAGPDPLEDGFMDDVVWKEVLK